MVRNAITWFEISVADMGRAQKFYETLLGVMLKREEMLGAQLAVFPADENGVAGCLQLGPHNHPGETGARVYLNVGTDLDAVLRRAESVSAAMVVPKTALPPGMGHFAIVRDSEGNHVGLHGNA